VERSAGPFFAADIGARAIQNHQPIERQRRSAEV
jgi:hypothetical protein